MPGLSRDGSVELLIEEPFVIIMGPESGIGVWVRVTGDLAPSLGQVGGAVSLWIPWK